jgi:hypothetical protein
LFLAGIAAASGDSLIILLNNHARLAFAGKTITNQDHLEYLSDPNDFPLVDRTNRPSLLAVHTS